MTVTGPFLRKKAEVQNLVPKVGTVGRGEVKNLGKMTRVQDRKSQGLQQFPGRGGHLKLMAVLGWGASWLSHGL